MRAEINSRNICKEQVFKISIVHAVLDFTISDLKERMQAVDQHILIILYYLDLG